MERKDREEGSRGASASQADSGQGGQARPSIREQADRAKQVGREKGAELKEAAGQKVEELKESATRRTDELTTRMGSRIDVLAQALHRACDELRDRGEPRLAQVTGGAAGHVERFGAYMDRRSPEEMISDLKRTAKRYPAYFVGGTLAVGLLIGRFLKADRPDQARSLASDQGFDAELGGRV